MVDNDNGIRRIACHWRLPKSEPGPFFCPRFPYNCVRFLEKYRTATPHRRGNIGYRYLARHVLYGWHTIFVKVGAPLALALLQQRFSKDHGFNLEWHGMDNQALHCYGR